jgi:NADPH:quinone reductase-like Zn-dependent oxidoreductase
MKAIVYQDFGSPDILRCEQIDKPIPGDNEVLIKVRAASVNPLDWHFLEGTPYLARLVSFGLIEPRVTRLGVDYAGTVVSVGKNVTKLEPGDEVFGARTGAFAEYVCVGADRAIAQKPPGLSFEEAASSPVAGITALQALRDKGKVRAGQEVLINGASGGVGTFAVQIAKSFGANVTGVCSTRNVDMVRSLGADDVIDYTKDDFTRSGRRFDLILDNVANRSLLDMRRVLKPNGVYVLIGGGGLNEGRWVGPFPRLIKTIALSPFVSQEMGMLLADLNEDDLAVLGELMRTGAVKPVIDRRYALGEVSEAIRYLEQGHARGKVVVTMEPGAEGPPAAAGQAARPVRSAPPGAIALALIGPLVGVPVAPIIVAFALNRWFQRRHPGKQPFRWGFYFGIQSIIAGLALGLLLETGAVAAVVCGAAYALLAWQFMRRRRWAWIALTILANRAARRRGVVFLVLLLLDYLDVTHVFAHTHK